MVQKKLTERPRGRSGKYNFGASANKHLVGQTKQADTLWRRDVHVALLQIGSPSTGEKAQSEILHVPGTGFTRQIRRVAFHGAISVDTSSSSRSQTSVGGVLEMVLGLAEDLTAFQNILQDSEAPGAFRRYVSFAAGAGVFKFWIPSGFNQLGVGADVPAGGPMNLYVGTRIGVISGAGSSYLQVSALISTQEKELRVYS